MQPAASTDGDADDAPGPRAQWLGHGTVLLPGSPTVVVDPWRGRPGRPCADVALITHDHIDHCSPDDLRAALRPGATVLAPTRATARLVCAGLGADMQLTVVSVGDEIRVGTDQDATTVTVLPAEGPIRDGRPSGFLPRGRGVSYRVGRPGWSALLLGDSLPLPEHAGLAPDVAFVAVGGLVTATPDEAAECVAALGAALVIPVHWGDIEARHGAAEHFVTLCNERGVTAVVAR